MDSEILNPYNSHSMVVFLEVIHLYIMLVVLMNIFRGNFCKDQIASLLKFLPDCRESSILEYCGTYYVSQRGGLEALCLYSKPHEISKFEDE
jgi:hypothetical protein